MLSSCIHICMINFKKTRFVLSLSRVLKSIVFLIFKKTRLTPSLLTNWYCLSGCLNWCFSYFIASDNFNVSKRINKSITKFYQQNGYSMSVSVETSKQFTINSIIQTCTSFINTSTFHFPFNLRCLNLLQTPFCVKPIIWINLHKMRQQHSFWYSTIKKSTFCKFWSW